MTDFINNDYIKNFNQFFTFQTEFAKQVIVVQKQLALEFLKNSKVIVDTVSSNIDSELKRLELTN